MFRPVLALASLALLAAIFLVAGKYRTQQFRVKIAGHDSTWVNNYAHVRVSIIPEGKWYISLKKSATIVVACSNNMSSSKIHFSSDDIRWNPKERSANFDIIIKGITPGLGSVTADVSFTTCHEDVCVDNTVELTKLIMVSP